MNRWVSLIKYVDADKLLNQISLLFFEVTWDWIRLGVIDFGVRRNRQNVIIKCYLFRMPFKQSLAITKKLTLSIDKRGE